MYVKIVECASNRLAASFIKLAVYLFIIYASNRYIRNYLVSHSAWNQLFSAQIFFIICFLTFLYTIFLYHIVHNPVIISVAFIHLLQQLLGETTI